MGSTSRSRSRGHVDRAQRCRMLRRFHQALIGRAPEGNDLLVLFTAEALVQIDQLIGGNDWKRVATGEDVYDEKWESPRSLSSQLVHVRKWYAESPNHSHRQEADVEGVTSTTDTNLGQETAKSDDFTNLDRRPMTNVHLAPDTANATDIQPTSNPDPAALQTPQNTIDSRLATMQVELVQVKAQYLKIPDSYHASLAAKKEASQGYRRLQAAQKASIDAEDRVKADKSLLHTSQQALDVAKAAMAATTDLGHMFAQLDLDRRAAKEQRNKAYETWAKSVARHHSAYNAWVTAEEAFRKAEAEEQVKVWEWKGTRRQGRGYDGP